MQRLVEAFPRPDVGDGQPCALIERPTESETAMLELIGSGASNGEIARELALSEGTVKVYLSRLYAKLGVSSRTQAVSKAKQLRLLE